MKNANRLVVRGAVALALGLVLPVSAHAALGTKDKQALAAQATEIQSVRDQVQALVERLNKLETANAQLQQSNMELKQANAQLQEQNTALKAQGDKVEKAIATVEKAREDQSDAIAKTAAKVASADWASKIKDRKSTRLNSSHIPLSRMPSSA